MLQLTAIKPTVGKVVAVSALFLLSGTLSWAKDFTLKSPDGSIAVQISTGKEIRYRVSIDDKTLIEPSAIAMSFADGSGFGQNASLKDVDRDTVKEILTPEVKVRSAKILNNYNQLRLNFDQGFSIAFRAFDQGVAYRFESSLTGEATLAAEEANFNFADGTFGYFPFEKHFRTATQPQFKPVAAKSIDADELGSLPALFVANGVNVLLTETDLQHYPGLWLRGHGDGRIFGVHPQDLDADDNDSQDLGKVQKHRTFPWRILAIARSDAELFDNQMSYTLAEPSRIADTSWIKPGHIAWDWYNENNLKGVDFEAGINTATYEYYADFAADFGIENILIDDGWSTHEDVLTVLPNIDMQEIIRHAKAKGVRVQLWVPWSGLDKQMEAAFKQYADWGISGVKIDFMNSDSIKRVDFYWRAAAMAAKYKLMVNFHGSYKPAGIHRTYPNVMTREGVRGLENNKWSEVTATHNLQLPFIRMIAGPMDYTPGAMANANRKNFNQVFSRPMSLTTRAQQVAMYVIYESPLQMLADTPTSYRTEPEIPTYLADIPTVWDDYKVLRASIGEYLVMARRAGDKWYLGAMTNEQRRSFSIKLDFLDKGDYRLKILRDGINAGHHAEDYKLETKDVKAGDEIVIDMAGSGGWSAQISKL